MEESPTTGPSECPLSSGSRLLSLPAELRAEIFGLVLAEARCRNPIVVWDGVCMGIISGNRHPRTTAILQVCWTTYNDCLSILYDNTTVEISIRSDKEDGSFPRFQHNFGPITHCALLTRIRHVELEVTYDCRSENITRGCDRLQRLGRSLRKLRTIDLVFFDETETGHDWQNGIANRLLSAAETLESERFVSISRNKSAKKSIDPALWREFQSKRMDFGANDAHEERFRVLSFDSFEHAFRAKN